jgi:hypothetical protein
MEGQKEGRKRKQTLREGHIPTRDYPLSFSAVGLFAEKVCEYPTPTREIRRADPAATTEDSVRLNKEDQHDASGYYSITMQATNFMPREISSKCDILK